ncbi:MAG: spheroidene monooxygenase [Roseitalea sp.]|jgi:spheroidene monooxygenase|nr:spheroidene monooxygenase [Roseitalea sp.]MBO6724001.1 spheroidene monooxygenase [Roseitalea sp.]MBO6742505.1 spheroidene monooxygenase [Roseitalea sp.]
MQIVTLSLYHFVGLPAELWAFSQMGLMRPAVARMEGLRFHKMMGTGAGAGFSTTPDFSTYTLLCVWDDGAAARKALDDATPFARYRARADRSATLHLAATQTRGQWSGAEPFAVDAQTRPEGPIVALTRATLRWSKLAAFWSLVPAISDVAEADPHQHFMMGMGEIPYKHQMTFSIWDDEAAMRTFSLASQTHGTAVRRAWDEGWFAESLFARFNLLAVEGAWPGLERFAAGAPPVPDETQPRQAA